METRNGKIELAAAVVTLLFLSSPPVGAFQFHGPEEKWRIIAKEASRAYRSKNFAESERLLRESIKQAKLSNAKQTSLLNLQVNLFHVLVLEKKMEEAILLYEQCRALIVHLKVEDEPVSLRLENRRILLWELQGDLARVLAQYRRVLDIRRKISGEDSKTYHEEFAYYCFAAIRQENFDLARRLIAEFDKLVRREPYEKDEFRVSTLQSQLASKLIDKGGRDNLVEAAQLLEKADKWTPAMLREPSQLGQAILTRYQLFQLNRLQGRVDEASFYARFLLDDIPKFGAVSTDYLGVCVSAKTYLAEVALSKNDLTGASNLIPSIGPDLKEHGLVSVSQVRRSIGHAWMKANNLKRAHDMCEPVVSALTGRRFSYPGLSGMSAVVLMDINSDMPRGSDIWCRSRISAADCMAREKATKASCDGILKYLDSAKVPLAQYLSKHPDEYYDYKRLLILASYKSAQTARAQAEAKELLLKLERDRRWPNLKLQQYAGCAWFYLQACAPKKERIEAAKKALELIEASRTVDPYKEYDLPIARSNYIQSLLADEMTPDAMAELTRPVHDAKLNDALRDSLSVAERLMDLSELSPGTSVCQASTRLVGLFLAKHRFPLNCCIRVRALQRRVLNSRTKKLD